MKRRNIFTGLLMLPLCLLLSMGAMAQSGQGAKHTPEERAARMVEQYKKQLNLTNEQTVKLQDIAKRAADSTKDLRANTSLSREERMGKMKSLREERENQVRAMLTAEQQQQYDAWQKKRDARQAQRGTERGHRRGRR